MRRARGLTMLALVALLVALPTTGAGSAELTEHGWWWQPQTGLLGVPVPTPPDVPEDGLLVEQGPDGPMAVAAVRFLVGSDEVEPVLVLEVAGATGDGAIVACPAAVRWQPAQAGRWDTAPPADCEAGLVEGVPDESGSAWSFALGPLASADGVVDVVLRPAGAAGPSRVAFTAPDDASVVVQTPPPPPPTPTAEPATDGQPAPPPVAVAPPPVAPPAPAPAPAAPEPQVAAPAPPAPSAAAEPPSPPPVAAAPVVESGPTPAALFLLVLLGLLILADLAAGVREQGLLAFVRTPDGSVRGGIGRFERERTEAPAPLW